MNDLADLPQPLLKGAVGAPLREEPQPDSGTCDLSTTTSF